MSRNAFEPIPKAERLIEFSEDDYKENHSVTHFDESLIRSKDWANFEKNALENAPTHINPACPRLSSPR